MYILIHTILRNMAFVILWDNLDITLNMSIVNIPLLSIHHAMLCTAFPILQQISIKIIHSVLRHSNGE